MFFNDSSLFLSAPSLSIVKTAEALFFIAFFMCHAVSGYLSVGNFNFTSY
ncbi:hypothetical protein B4107_0385 [Bacillus safensis]|nr:hypothetical protein B4107_0385 [Bacillus safensis]